MMQHHFEILFYPLSAFIISTFISLSLQHCDKVIKYRGSECEQSSIPLNRMTVRFSVALNKTVLVICAVQGPQLLSLRKMRHFNSVIEHIFWSLEDILKIISMSTTAPDVCFLFLSLSRSQWPSRHRMKCNKVNRRQKFRVQITAVALHSQRAQ